MTAVLNRLWGMGRAHRGVLAAAFACMAVLGATTGLFAWLMGPVLRFLLTGGGEGLSAVARWVPRIELADRGTLLWLLPGGIVVIGALKGVAYLGQFYWMGVFGQRVAMDVRRALFEKLGSLSPIDASRELTGDLLARFTADVAAVEQAATYTVGSYARDGLQIVVLLGVAVAADWRLALGTLLVVPVAAWPVSRLTRHFMALVRTGQRKLGELAGQVQEGIGGIRTIQAFGGQSAELKRFGVHAQEHQRALVRAGWARGVVPGLMEVLAAVALGVVLSLTAQMKTLSPEHLVSFLTALILVYQPAKDLGRVGQFGVQAAAAGERILDILDRPAAVPDAEGARALAGIRSGVRLEGVHFRYGERRALDGVWLDIRIGQVTALVGPSGGGKSTVAALLMRQAVPGQGRLLIDGTDVSGLTAASVRAQFALVTQEPRLFAASVVENIRFGRPDATADQVAQAARVAQADGFISQLPHGYETPVGERGVVLSGGQKQRICLARALLANRPVLILDEATSNLDPEGEREVQRALDAVLPGRTALVVAHRLSTVVGAHAIYVMDEGRVVEHGAHRELMAKGGLYARLWSLQERPEAA